MSWLGWIYSGHEVPAQDHAWACYLLGLSYQDGQGVRRNLRWAKYWLTKAASMKVKEARKALAKLESSL